MTNNTRLLLPVGRKKLVACFGKLSIIIIAILANMHSVVAQRGDTIVFEEYRHFVLNAPKYEKPSEVTITGFVKDINGNPLVNAMVSTVSGNSFPTGNEGEFFFQLRDSAVMVQNIFASYKDMVTEVRSYDPAMINPVYNITLHKPAICCLQLYRDSTIIEPIKLNFKKETKNELDSITSLLKKSPEKKIVITAYSGPSKSSQLIADSQLDAIKRKLIEKYGISSDRIIIKKLIDTTNSISIRIE